MNYIDEYRSKAKEYFGISYLRPYQELVIRHILEAEENEEGSNLLVCLPTGSGKSICFMLPSLIIKKKTIILYPLLSLMKDQENRFRNAGIPAITLKGGMDKDILASEINRFLLEEASVLITNPEMLLYLIESNRIKKAQGDISMMIIDEAHTSIVWGESFRESFLKLPEIIDYLQPKHISAYTATMDKRIESGIIKLIFKSKTPYIIHASADRENIFYHSIKSYSKLSDIKQILYSSDARPALIFCRSRAETEVISEQLSRFFDIKPYHAGMDKQRRREIEDWFMDSMVGILAATTAYGMGVDKKGIRTVIHLSIPDVAANFLQESGRCGRDGRRADSYVLYHPNEERRLSYIFKGKTCIRSELLKLMNETPEDDRCLACSSCSGEEYVPFGFKAALKVIRKNPLITLEAVNHKLSAKRVFRRDGLWTMQDTKRAIEDYLKDGFIKVFLKKHFLITRKGIEQLKKSKTYPN